MNISKSKLQIFIKVSSPLGRMGCNIWVRAWGAYPAIVQMSSLGRIKRNIKKKSKNKSGRNPNAGEVYGIEHGVRILVSVALLGSVIIQMSSLGRVADGQHNYPVYLNCHLAHLASSPLPPSSISQTLFLLSTDYHYFQHNCNFISYMSQGFLCLFPPA